jgi:2-amino-4-hydroxy-6-hydroxymethyldihydropteridine diphosphokinase
VTDTPTQDRPDEVRAVIGMGTNVGDRLATLEAAIWSLDESDGIEVRDVSGIWETAPWGGVEQGPFLNAVVVVTTTLSPHALLADLQATEAAFGRDRDAEVRWGPRTLDLDILLYGDEVVATDDLVVPHPRLTERAFVLVPLLEVLPGHTLPDGTRLTRALTALAPFEGMDLHIRLSDVPGRTGITRPEGPGPRVDWRSDEA